MIALQITYPPGTFHEAPWIRGPRVLEWPPSPFLLLQTIVVGWIRSANGDIESLMRLCDLLAGDPTFNLPPSNVAHVVHYGSASGLSKAHDEISPALDTFGGHSTELDHLVSTYAIWPSAQLDAEDAELLKGILSNIRDLRGYLCAFSLATSLPQHLDRIDVRPAAHAEGDGPIVRRLAVGPNVRGADLLKTLLRDATNHARESRTMPNETRLVDYRFPPQFGLDKQDVFARDRARADLPPRIERFRLRPASGSRGPLITETLSISEAMRWASMRASSARELRAADPVLSGKSPSGGPAVGHGHAFFLPRDLDGDGRIDHLDIWYPTGSSVETHRATIGARLLYDHRLDGRYYLDYVGDVQPLSGIRWRSATPFVLERHVKTNGRGSSVIKSDAPRDQVFSSLVNHGIATRPIDVVVDVSAPVAKTSEGRPLNSAAFRRARLKEKHAMPGFFVELLFPSIIEGPIVAGRHTHFGLGQFVPIS